MQQQIAQQQHQLEYQQNLQQQMRMQQQSSTPGVVGGAPPGYFMHPQSPMVTDGKLQQQVGTSVGFSNESDSQKQQTSGFMPPTPLSVTNSQHCDSPNNIMLYSQQQQQMHRNLSQQMAPASGIGQNGKQQSQMFANLTDFADDNVNDLIPEDGLFFYKYYMKN